MFTRKDYLDGKCTHGEYYSQYVTPEIEKLVSTLGPDKIKAAAKVDEYMNNIPLRQWDSMTNFFHCKSEMEKHGDYPTLAGKVCILKEAARKIANK